MGDNEETFKGRGVVKFFNDSKGFGFVQLSDNNWEVEDDCREIFVHHTKIKMEGHRRLHKDQRVEVEYHKETKGFKADHVVPDAKWLVDNHDIVQSSSEGRSDGYNRGGGGGYDRGYGGRGGYDDRNQDRYHGGGGYDRSHGGGYGGGGGSYGDRH